MQNSNVARHRGLIRAKCFFVNKHNATRIRVDKSKMYFVNRKPDIRIRVDKSKMFLSYRHPYSVVRVDRSKMAFFVENHGHYNSPTPGLGLLRVKYIFMQLLRIIIVLKSTVYFCSGHISINT